MAAPTKFSATSSRASCSASAEHDNNKRARPWLSTQKQQRVIGRENVGDLDFDRLQTLGDIPRYHADVRPNATALTFEGRATSYAAFDKLTDKVAAALTAAGLKPGDRVSYVGKNSDHYFEVVFGAAKAGVVMAPVGWRLAPPEIAFIVDDADAKILFYGPEIAPVIRQIRPDLPKVQRYIAMEPAAGEENYENWRDSAPALTQRLGVKPHDIALQLYTSGTTGRPKGAMLTHHNLLGSRRAAMEADLGWNRWSSEDVSLVAMPVSHIGGTGWGIVGLLNGATGLVAREFDPTKVIDYIVKDSVSQMFMVPAALQFVVRIPGAREQVHGKMRNILYGASPIPLDLLRECMDVFGCGFCQQYGMTETTGTIVYLPPEDHDPAGNARMRGAGKAMPGVELRILDADGKALAPNTVGEVATRSVANMAGYWRRDDATASTIDGEGWLRTGDAGYLDEDGYLFIQDRVKDMIISGGENIYPAEVESAIYGHPGVAEVAVIGVPDDKWGEAVKAIVVRKPGQDPTPDEIIAFARSRIAAFKSPKSVDFIEVLPRNASGKILRRELREPFWEGKGRRVN